MHRKVNLKMQYNEDSVFVFELGDNGKRYEVVRWTVDEIEETDNLVETVENTREMVENSPRGLIEKLYGSVENWDAKKEDRKLD